MLTAILTSACAFPGVLPGREANHDADDLRDRESSFFAALADRDAERVAAHFADDAALHVADMPPIQGREAIGTFYSRLLRYLSATTSISERLRISASGDLAYTTGSVTNVFDGGDGRAEYPGKYLLVWERRGAEWEIVLYAVSSNQPETDGAG